MLAYADEITLAAMTGAIQFPAVPMVHGFLGGLCPVTVILDGENLDDALLIAATLIKARGCDALAYTTHILADALDMPRQILGHGFSLGDRVSYMLAYSMDDLGKITIQSPYRLSVVAPAVEILDCGLKGDVDDSHLVTARKWLVDHGHGVALRSE